MVKGNDYLVRHQNSTEKPREKTRSLHTRPRDGDAERPNDNMQDEKTKKESAERARRSAHRKRCKLKISEESKPRSESYPQQQYRTHLNQAEKSYHTYEMRNMRNVTESQETDSRTPILTLSRVHLPIPHPKYRYSPCKH